MSEAATLSDGSSTPGRAFMSEYNQAVKTMRSEQDKSQDTSKGRSRRQHHSSPDGDERFEGQYEKDPWRPDWRAGQRHPVGEGSSGGYWSAARRYPPGPQGYQRSDERLREDISERLMEADYVDTSDVTVQVSGAKVVLDGTVPERRMKHAIEDLVDACPGVLDIDNRIRVKR